MNPLLSAIGGLAFEGGVFTDLPSTDVFVTGVFSPAAGDDVDQPLLPARKDVILLITDGIQSIDQSVAEATSAGIQKYGVTFFVICILTGCTESWAKAVASKPEKVRYTMNITFHPQLLVRETFMGSASFVKAFLGIH